MHSLISNCCGTHFRLVRMVLRSFIRHNTTELFLSFLLYLQYKMALNKILN